MKRTSPAGDTGDSGLIPWLGRSPGGGNGNPLQYACLKNPVGRGTWWAIVHRVTGVGHDWVTKRACSNTTVIHLSRLLLMDIRPLPVSVSAAVSTEIHASWWTRVSTSLGGHQEGDSAWYLVNICNSFWLLPSCSPKWWTQVSPYQLHLTVLTSVLPTPALQIPAF